MSYWELHVCLTVGGNTLSEESSSLPLDVIVIHLYLNVRRKLA